MELTIFPLEMLFESVAVGLILDIPEVLKSFLAVEKACEPGIILSAILSWTYSLKSKLVLSFDESKLF